MRRSRALSRSLVAYSAVRSWVECITNMCGFDLRQAQRSETPDRSRKENGAADDAVGPSALALMTMKCVANVEKPSHHRCTAERGPHRRGLDT